MEREQLEAFIRQNWELMTMKDMANKIGTSYYCIRDACRRMGIVSKSSLEIKLQFVQHQHQHFSFQETAKKLKVAETYLQDLCQEAHVPLSAFKKASPEELSPLDTFIVHNWEFMTLPDLAEESGASYVEVRLRCNILGIIPKSPTEIKLKFLQDNHEQLTAARVKKMLGITGYYFGQLCKKASIPMNAFKQAPETEVISAREVLSSYHFASSSSLNLRLEQDLLDQLSGTIRRS